MSDSGNVSISLPKALYDQAEVLAQALDTSADAIIRQAVTQYLLAQSEREDEPDRVIRQGDVYWLQLTDSATWKPGMPPQGVAHPHVVVQDDLFNRSRISTVIVCALTSNLNRVNMPGNILLDEGEAQLPRRSVIEVSKVSTVEKTQLGEFIGSLTEQRIQQILAGMRFVQASFTSGQA